MIGVGKCASLLPACPPGRAILDAAEGIQALGGKQEKAKDQRHHRQAGKVHPAQCSPCIRREQRNRREEGKQRPHGGHKRHNAGGLSGFAEP